MAFCYLIWGFQPLYFALDQKIDTAFLLAGRIVWAAVSCLLILKVQGKLGELTEIFQNKEIMKREIPASFLLLADWTIYLIGIRTGRVMECSMGYYIMPLVMVMFGALLYREKLAVMNYVAIGCIIVGIILSYKGFGGFPVITISLSLAFAVYSAIKKGLTVDSIVSTTSEILMMLPFALIFVLFFRMRENGMEGVTFSRQLFIIGSGLVTGLPMVFFAKGLSGIPLSFTGILQYVSPSLGILCSLILGESFTVEKLRSFLFIWVGVIVYTVFEIRSKRKE